MQFISGNASAADTMATSAVSDQPSPASSPGEFNATVELPGLGGASPFEFSGSQGGISGAGSKSLGLDTQQFVPDALRASAYPSA
jgi:hypothetical protein